MTRKYAALAALGTLAACGLPRLRPVEVGDTLVFETREATARVTVERLGDCDSLRAEAKQLTGPRDAWIDLQAEGNCAWASGTLAIHFGKPDLRQLTVIEGARGFDGYNRGE